MAKNSPVNKLLDTAYLWKLPLCGLVFLISTILLGSSFPILGWQLAALLPQGEPITILAWFFTAGLILAFVLSIVSRNLKTGWLARWIVLAEITWVCGAIGLIGANLLSMKSLSIPDLVVALMTMLNFLVPGLLTSAVTALLFKPQASVKLLTTESLSITQPQEWLTRTAVSQS